MKNGMRNKTLYLLIGYAAFFLLVTAIAVSSILLFWCVWVWSGSLALAIWLTAVNVLALTAICIAIETLRRKRSVNRPVAEILSATERMISGDYDVRLRPRHVWGRYDEYDLIMENVSRLSAELSKTESLRGDFIANVSHEIKTPLAVIRSYALALRDKNPDADTRKEYVDTLIGECGRLTVLVADILKLSKLENSELLPERAEIDLGEQLRECAIAVGELAEKKGVELVCDIDDVTVRSDAGLLAVIWNNLLSNAVKFTESGGSVFLSLARTGGKAVVCVRDTGCGISRETGEHIFEKFYQGDTSHSGEGNGLGLALVKKAIDLLGGEITVKSVVGEGSAFTVKIDAEPT